jgi:hypothetical protein
MSPATARVIDPILTNLAQGYRQSELVGEALFPRVPVSASGGQVIQFGKEAFMSYQTLRAPGTNVRRVSFGYAGSSYALKNHALEAQVPIEIMRDAQAVPGVDMAQRAVNLVLRAILLGLEIDQAELALTAGNYDSNHKVALGSGAKWSESAVDASTAIETAREAIRTTCGLYPNTMLLSATAWKALRNNQILQGRIKYTQKGVITTDLIAELFDIPNVVVGKAIKSTDAGVLSDVWGDNVVLAYVAKGSAGLEEPSYGYTYTMEGHPAVEAPYYDNNSRSWIYPTAMERAPVLSGILSGYLIQNTN